MSKPRLIPEEELKILAHRYNQVRMSFSGRSDLSKAEVISSLKAAGFPTGTAYYALYAKYGLIRRIAKIGYQFPQEPVYYKVFRDFLREARESSRNGYYKYANAKKVLKPSALVESESVPTQPSFADFASEDNCVAFLKARGYLILKIC